VSFPAGFLRPRLFPYQVLTFVKRSGKTLTIKASGTFSEVVEKGAYVNLQVKYGLIRLINTKADLCDQIKNVDLECPLKRGETELSKDVDLPKEIPPVSAIVVLLTYRFPFLWQGTFVQMNYMSCRYFSLDTYRAISSMLTGCDL
jgi:hypothetical protein